MFIAVAAVGGLIHPRVRAGEVIAWPSAPAARGRVRTIHRRTAAAGASATHVAGVRPIVTDQPDSPDLPDQGPSPDTRAPGRGADAAGRPGDAHRGTAAGGRGADARGERGPAGGLSVSPGFGGVTKLPSITAWPSVTALPSVTWAARDTTEPRPATEPRTTQVLLTPLPAGTTPATDEARRSVADEARRSVTFADLTDEELAYVGRSYDGLADEVELLETADDEPGGDEPGASGPADGEFADGEPEDGGSGGEELGDHGLGDVGPGVVAARNAAAAD